MKKAIIPLAILIAFPTLVPFPYPKPEIRLCTNKEKTPANTIKICYASCELQTNVGSNTVKL